MDEEGHEEHPLHSHNPWSDPPEADIDDIRTMPRPPGSFMFQPTPPGFMSPHQRPPGAEPSAPNMGTLFGNMMNLMGQGGPGMPSSQHHHQHQHQHQHPTADEDDNSFRSRSAPGSRTPSERARSARPHFEIYTSSGPGFSFRATSSTAGGRAGQFTPGGDAHEPYMGGDLRQYVDALRSSHAPLFNESQTDTIPSRLVDSIIGAHMGYRQGDPRGEQTAGGGFAAANPMDFLQHLMNPAGAPSGDFASSQQAFDQILSGLMDEHQSGSAPGPASAEAIESLPKKAADAEILGNAEKEDCSICMSEVTMGDIVSILPCNHWFHPDCAKMWLKEHDTCPICRVGIMSKSEDVNARAGTTDPHGVPHHPVRSPGEAPLHNEDPFELARRQSGTRNNPIIVSESPTRDRRQLPHRHQHFHQQVPSAHRRYSSDPPSARTTSSRSRHGTGQRSPAAGEPRSGGAGNGRGGITGGLRRMFGGTGGGTGAGSGGGTGSGGSRR